MQRRWQNVRRAVRRWGRRIFGADKTWWSLLPLAVVAVGFSIWQWEWLREVIASLEFSISTLLDVGPLTVGVIAAAVAVRRLRMLTADNVWRAVVAGLLALAVAGAGFSIWQWDWLRGRWRKPGIQQHRATQRWPAGRRRGGRRPWPSGAAASPSVKPTLPINRPTLRNGGLLNERYQKGAEMLGSSVLAVRPGRNLRAAKLGPRASETVLYASYTPAMRVCTLPHTRR